MNNLENELWLINNQIVIEVCEGNVSELSNHLRNTVGLLFSREDTMTHECFIVINNMVHTVISSDCNGELKDYYIKLSFIASKVFELSIRGCVKPYIEDDNGAMVIDSTMRCLNILNCKRIISSKIRDCVKKVGTLGIISFDEVLELCEDMGWCLADVKNIDINLLCKDNNTYLSNNYTDDESLDKFNQELEGFILLTEEEVNRVNANSSKYPVIEV